MNELMEWNVFHAIHQYGLDTNTLHSIHTKLPCYLSAQFEVVVIPNVDQHQMFFMSKKLNCGTDDFEIIVLCHLNHVWLRFEFSDL